MGKVQDTINRIARRHRHNATQAIALIIPTQKKPGKNSFPTSYNAVAKWLTTQTSASYHDQLNGLTRALQHSNRLSNSATERLKITTLFDTQVTAVIPSLKKQCIDAELPYTNEVNQSFDCSTTLLREMAYGYKIAIVDVLLRRSGLHRLDRVHAIYFAMRCLGELGLRYAQSYQPWPAKCWRDINTLYWLAEKEGASNDEILAANRKDGLFPPTIGQLYTALAMFHSSKSSHLPPADMEQLMAALSRLAARVPLQKHRPPSTDTLYSTALNSANAPSSHRFCNYTAEDQVRYLELAPAARALSELQPSPSDKNTLSRLQVQKILHIWGNQRQRHAPRAISNGAATVHTGFKECHALLQQQRDKHNVFLKSNGWQLINRSDDGLCLRCKTDQPHNLHVGDLISCQLHENAAAGPSTGIVRWINVSHSRDVQIGIETLTNRGRPVICEKHLAGGKAREPRHEALIFKPAAAREGTTAIILSTDQYRLGDSVRIYDSYHSETFSSFKLAEAIDYDATFICFRIQRVAVETPEELVSLV